MARYIHCEKCKNRMLELAKKHDELYEYMEGVALNDMYCDGGCHSDTSPTEIKKGEKCFASVLLPSMQHCNYELQHPLAWAHNYIQLI